MAASEKGLFFMAGMANWDPGTNQTHSHTLAAFRRKHLPVLPPLKALRAWRVMQVSRTEPGTEVVQQTAASCCGPALCPRTLAVTVPLLLWLEPKGTYYEIFRQVCLNSILKSPNDLSDEFLAHHGDHAYCVAEAPALSIRYLSLTCRLLHTGECLDVAQSRSQSLGQNAGYSHWFPQCVPPPSTLASLHVLSHAPRTPSPPNTRTAS